MILTKVIQRVFEIIIVFDKQFISNICYTERNKYMVLYYLVIRNRAASRIDIVFVLFDKILLYQSTACFLV